jgi:osmotically-inducible protein OsmY
MMKTSIVLAALTAACGIALAACDKTESTTVKTGTTTAPVDFATTTTATKPDNTAINRRDQNTTNLTPVDQSNDAADIKITADIRRSLMDDKDLSTNAHNAKIITSKGGAVTLRGVVDTAGEKETVETKAKAITGVNSVDNQLEVKVP